MKTVAVILALLVAGFFWYDHFKKQGLTGRLPVITDPYYAEIRATNNMGGREIELALFARARNEADCLGGTKQGWANIVKTCPTCTAQAPKCMKELPPRYARLFDDAPIPSAYLSATAASLRERDLRVVIYGLTDQEGIQVCEMLRTELTKTFTGPAHCIAPSGG